MHTEHPSPGKFEGIRSTWMAEVVYAASMDGPDDEFGDVTEGEHVCLVLGKRYGFILVEDSNGFVTVDFQPRGEARRLFDILVEERQDPNLCEGCGEPASVCGCWEA